MQHDRQGVLSEAVQRAYRASEAQVRGVDRSLEVFSDAIGAILDEGGRVSLADVAHTNGPDDELMGILEAAGQLPRFVGNGGWNTAGNALGSAVALGCLSVLVGGARSAERASRGWRGWR